MLRVNRDARHGGSYLVQNTNDRAAGEELVILGIKFQGAITIGELGVAFIHVCITS